ncbi:MAG TPA: hypothetical protein V6C81_21250 [Planktothrix sp.]|jgi:hypothetical protein
MKEDDTEDELEMMAARLDSIPRGSIKDVAACGRSILARLDQMFEQRSLKPSPELQALMDRLSLDTELMLIDRSSED